jgi:hypothetical protein
MAAAPMLTRDLTTHVPALLLVILLIVGLDGCSRWFIAKKYSSFIFVHGTLKSPKRCVGFYPGKALSKPVFIG